MEEVALLYTTWPSAETAQAFAAEAVADELAACANVLAPMRSLYRWQGAVEEAVETPMLLKTSAAALPRLLDRLKANHPHELPCILRLAVEPDGSNPAFLEWIVQQTRAAAAAPE